MPIQPSILPFSPGIIKAALAVCLSFATMTVAAQPVGTLDLLGEDPDDGQIQRILGSEADGSWGVPVAGGYDMDGDGDNDYAFAAFRAGRSGAADVGKIYLIFGDGEISGTLDTAASPTNILEILGDQAQENAGSEIWMADVTGDGLGDLLICRQNYSPAGRTGAGALTIIPGQAALKTEAANSTTIDLREAIGVQPIELVTILGAATGDRFCIWARNGDLAGGDLAHEFVVGADQTASNGETHSGAAWIFRGGSYLESRHIIDLSLDNTTVGTASPGNIARLIPPTSASHHHFGATVQMGDLDGNGQAEVLIAATLNRAGAALPPVGASVHGSGGAPAGWLYIAWDDKFAGDWINPVIDGIISSTAGTHSVIKGGQGNDRFGEEILAGLDYDNDDRADLFVGDITGGGGFVPTSRSTAGLGHVFYNAADLKGLDFRWDFPPASPELSISTFLGPGVGAIAADTALHGDFNFDCIDDLAFSSPNDDPFGRTSAGTIHVLLGKNGQWPVFSDLAPGAGFPTPAEVEIFEIYGALGTVGSDGGDTLAYSAAAGDLNGDGHIDLLTNEMKGNGSSLDDPGNLILFNAAVMLNSDTILCDGFESL